MNTLKHSFGIALSLLTVGVITSPAATLIWDADPLTPGVQDGAGTWDTTTNTWWDGSGNVVWVNGVTAAGFGVGSGAAGTITLGVPISVPQILNFNSAGSTNYTISGSAVNTLTLTGTPSISANVDAALNVVLAGVAFTKLGGGTLSLRPPANNTYVGTTLVNIGTLALNSSTGGRILIPGDLTINLSAIVTNTGSSGPVADTATVTVNSSATYAAGTDVIGSLVLAGGAVLQVGSDTITAATIDARSGSVIEAPSAVGKVDGNLTKTTAGTVTLFSRGSAAASGGLTNTIVNAGTLVLDYGVQSASKLLDTGSLEVNGGTLVMANGSTAETVGAVLLAGGVITNTVGTSRLNLTSGSYDVRSGASYTVFSGAGGLTKTTPGTVILAATNTHSGGTTISAGTLQLGNGIINGSINQGPIVNNATLVLNPAASALSIITSGTGSLVKIGGGTAALTQINTYQGSTTISNGVLSVNGSATLGDATGTLTLAGGTLSSTSTRPAGSAPIANPVNLLADSTIATTSTASTVDLNLSNDSISGSAGTLTFRNNGADAGTDIFQPRFSGSGFNFSRPIIIDNGPTGLTRLDSYNPTATVQTFSGVISGNGGYRRNASTPSGGGTTIFSANNAYTGATDVNRGTLLVNGSLGASTVTVGADGTLGGHGTINGPVTVSGGGTLSVGASIGRLTINNSLTFQANSTNLVEVSRNGSVLTNDAVIGLSSVAFAGTLIVNDVGPSALQLGDSFQLFNLGGGGNFTISGSPGGGNVWSFNPATGVLSVVASGNPSPPPLDFAHIGNNIQFSWTNALFKLQAQTNSLGTGIVTNNSAWFDYPGGGSSPVPAPIDLANGCVFFRLLKP